MVKSFFLTTLFIVVYSQEHDFLHFSKNENILSQCIERHRVFKDSEKGIVKFIANNAAKKFSLQVKNIKEIRMDITDILLNLEKEIPSSSKRQIPWVQLEIAILSVILDCSEKYKSIDNVDSKPSVQTNLASLPAFDNMLEEVDDLLDFILVDWPTPLQHMINTQDGQLLMKRFATDALIVLDRALDSIENRNHFRVILRTVWMLRARLYFDARDTQFPYIRHRYTTDRNLLAEGDINLFYNRSTQNFRVRNPSVSEEAVNRILSIHRVTSSPGYGEFDIFSEYERNGMTEAEYYLETHIDQFYRILLFFAISRAECVKNNRGDSHDKVIQRVNKAILYNDEIYGKSLATARECVVKAMKRAQMKIEQRFFSRRIIEEDLILALIFNIKNEPADTTITTIKFLSTTQRSIQSRIRENELSIEDSSSYNIGNESTSYTVNTTSKITQKNLENTNQTNKSTIDNGSAYKDTIGFLKKSEAVSNDNDVKNVNLTHHGEIPKFESEPPCMANLLDLILVDWPKPLRDMIENREDRALLRCYASQALRLLYSALSSVKTHDHFRVQLRVMWIRRAQSYFDGYSDEYHRYIPYRYTAERGLHTYDDLHMYYNRRHQNFSERNPPVPQSYVGNIINGYVRESTPFKRGISSAQYYFETHVDQFYRVLLFFIQLELSSIITSEDDVWEGRVPYDNVSKISQAIVYNDSIYLDAFSSDSFSPTEEELVMTFGKWFRLSYFGTVLDNNCSSVTVPDFLISTTPKYPENNFKKIDLKKKKNKESFNKRTETKVSKHQKKSKTSGKECHGFYFFNDNRNPILFSEKESSIFLKTLHNILKPYS